MGKRIIYLTHSLSLFLLSPFVDHCYFAWKWDVKHHGFRFNLHLERFCSSLGEPQQHTCQSGSLFPVFTSKYSAAAAPRTGTDSSWSCSSFPTIWFKYIQKQKKIICTTRVHICRCVNVNDYWKWLLFHVRFCTFHCPSGCLFRGKRKVMIQCWSSLVL